MKVATRLTLMMLACLAPIALVYTFVTARSTTEIFSADLKAETRVTQRALNASLTPDIQQGEWDEVRYILAAISLRSAGRCPGPSGQGAVCAHGFSRDAAAVGMDHRGNQSAWRRGIHPGRARAGLVLPNRGARSGRARLSAGRAGLDGVPQGSLSADWRVADRDCGGAARDRNRNSTRAAHRYVTQPLAQLHRRVSDLAGAEGVERQPDGDEFEIDFGGVQAARQ